MRLNSLAQSGESGVFNYIPVGESLYCFASVAEDMAGNKEAEPEDNGDSCTIYDTTPPSSQAISPEKVREKLLGIDWTAVDDLSGIKAVTLWVRFNGGAWKDAGLPSQSDASALTSGQFVLALPWGPGVYDFATQAVDRAGNEESLPTTADTTTVYEEKYYIYVPVVISK